ncbi:MAG TPA: ABC transporter permease subunit [Planctomycetota bacterium]|nr:ABC transporter permease subunit [Planctomycetota bacterium]
MATTNTEIYRKFQGQLRRAPLRFLPLAAASIRTATKRKFPLLVLYAPLLIATVIFSFVVYVRFSLAAGRTPDAFGGSANPAMAMMTGVAETVLQVKRQIVLFHLATTTFAFLIVAWFGAGLIAEDKRLGAHLLYFARPLTRLDYLLAKFTTLAFFGAFAVIVPPLVICTVATFASPDWAFLEDEGDLIPKTILFGLVWILVCASVILAISSLSSRKSFALVATFAVFVLPVPVSGVLSRLEHEPRFQTLSLPGNFVKLAQSLFGFPSGGRSMRYDVEYAYGALAVITLVAWIVLVVRVRRLEAVA